ncbi:organomercurial lyase MerB [Rhodococcus qingshengii]|nr:MULTISPECIES: organomercurial lyase MerB [Rhodococcus]MDV8128872.1 organomercurial lyase MerB [Rhodococcus sp. IEGM 1304]OXM18030.1 alkylmercury lyase [Rhodococcus erythropolis]
MNSPIQQLADRLNDTLGTAHTQPWLWPSLLRLLAHGEPVTLDQLATATGRSAEEIRHALQAMPDTEYDEHGRIIGSGITLKPTPHRFETGGATLYTWCALDTLIFPAVLGRTAQVTSPCHTSGTPVRLTVEPDRVAHLDPATAVVSVVTPDAPDSIRTAFCNQVHFFASADAARGWLDTHPGATVLPVVDAYALGRPLTQQLLTGDTPPSCSC